MERGLSRAYLLISALVLTVRVSVAAEESLAPLSLATEGRTKYKILLADHAAPAERYVASELGKILEEITGAAYPIVRRARTSTDALIVVGRNGLVDQLMGPSAFAQLLPEDGFRIATKGRVIILAGSSPRATVYAVYYFLENYLGCRWYSAKYSILPKRKSVTLNAIDVVEKPRFQYREVFSKPADNMLFRATNRLNGRFGHAAYRSNARKYGGAKNIQNITVFDLVSPRKYKQGNPEYFGGGQLRFANVAVQQLAVKSVREQLRSLPHLPTYLLISPEDRETYYGEGKDKLLIEEGRSPAAAYVEFMRVIANAVRNEFPEVRILALAYRWSRKPPVTKKLPENMGIMLSDIDVDFAMPLTSAENQVFLDHLEGWSQLTDEIIVWDYIVNMANYLQPYPNIPTLVENLRILAAYPSVIGVFAQGAYSSQGGEFSELKAWVLAKVLWNPTLEPSLLIEDFATGFYGAAAPYILKYLALLNTVMATNPTPLEVKMPVMASYLTADFLRKADRLLEGAENVVSGDTQYRLHVQGARIPVDYAILATGDGTESRKDRRKRYRRFRKYIRKLGVTAYREGKKQSASTETLLKILAVPRNRTAMPAECAGGGTRDCVQVQEHSFKLAGDASLVADELASDGGAARMLGKSRVWGIQLPLSWILPSDGEWKIFIDTRIENGDGRAEMPALRAGIYPGRDKLMRTTDQQNQSYTSFALPGSWKRNPRRTIWIAPAGGRAVQYIYVDRVFAVRTQN